MSPACMSKLKQSMHQQKPKLKNSKNKQNHTMNESITVMDMKRQNEENIYIELDTKCSCPQSKSNNNASIQFSRRYLQCQSSMPIAILRSYIQQILPHSSSTQVTLYDSNDRLLQDSALLTSLKTSSSSSLHIPIRFTLFNTITSLGHCLCSSPPFIQQQPSFPSSSSSPSTIKRETINQTLSTCSLIQKLPTRPSSSVISPTLSSSSSSSLSSSTYNRNEISNSISIVNLLTPPLSSSSPTATTVSSSSCLIANNVNDQSFIDEITSQFGEICPPLRKKPRNRVSKKVLSTYSSNVPLDLSLKKRPSSYDLFSSQAKWIKT